jgi:hypothetical protein
VNPWRPKLTSTPLKIKFQTDLKKSLIHLEYSYNKIQKLNPHFSESDEETLETFESFAARFSRSSDIFTSHYLRLQVLEQDPGFRGSFLDLLNIAEKLKLIESTKIWFRIRELRNIAAHEYTGEELKKLYQEMTQLTPTILELQNNL